MTNGEIWQPGVVVSVTPEKVSVRIIARSACGSCTAKSLCGAGDIAEKIIEVKKPSGQYKVGEQVVVSMSNGLGARATLFGYLFPFVLLIVSLITLDSLGVAELTNGLFSIGVLVPYFFVLWVLRKKFEKRFVFGIQSMNEQSEQLLSCEKGS
ncbi:MAG TPA: SoxR reducing system RseC family protein [Bacteroidales bacterium]|nr:SoxR reducing system RseC family protein [Bacteroidales bacterium]